MRVNPFSTLNRDSNNVKGDCSYINDFGSGVFERVCQLDSYSARAMIMAGVSGYEESKYGEVDSHAAYVDQMFWADVGNKYFVALWVEGGSLVCDDAVVFGVYNHDGRYYLTKCNTSALRAVMIINPNLHISERMAKGIDAAVGI